MKRSGSLLPAVALFLVVAACGRKSDDAPLSVSVIGDRLAITDPNREALDAAGSLMISAVAQGLVRFDGAGQIEPALAIRWAISQDGLYYTFRLADIDGIDAELVAKRLRAVIASRSRNALKPVLGAIREVVAVTPEVVEIRLLAPRPGLLDLLAAPEMGIIDRKILTGPFELKEENEKSVVLRPMLRGDDSPPDGAKLRRMQVMLRSERAAMAVARFAAGSSDLVLGGRFSDLSIAQNAPSALHALRTDPASGLFGLIPLKTTAPVGDSEIRRALAMSLDRERITSALGVQGWQAATSLIPLGTLELQTPVQPGWAGQSLAVRRNAAANMVRLWKTGHPGQPMVVKLLLPEGPGSTLLFALIRADWMAIGIDTQRAGGRDADLRLIDEVAPGQSASWYLRHFTCDRSVICSEAADADLDTARTTPQPAERVARLTDADLRLAEVMPYIPIAQPLRWSLVGSRVTGFVANNRAVHPLNHLRE
jgi:peptide/nickel transport system substrate-binding protein